MSLVINGYSGSSLLNTIKSLNFFYSDDELIKIKGGLKIELDLFKQEVKIKKAMAEWISSNTNEIMTPFIYVDFIRVMWYTSNIMVKLNI